MTIARGEVRVGCSGWSYRDWRGVVYPPQSSPRKWFACYAELFDTVELNSTFYRLPSASTVRKWAAQAPPGFLYTFKVGQFGSHRKKLRDAATWLPNHVERAAELGPARGPNLLQLPPRWHRDVERLEEFFAAAPTSWRWAVELRDPSWLHDDVFSVLSGHRAALCVHDLLENHPWVRTTDWSYIRFHGPAPRPSPTSVVTVPAAWPARRGGSKRGSRKAATCTPTSTTTCTARRSTMPVGCKRRLSR